MRDETRQRERDSKIRKQKTQYFVQSWDVMLGSQPPNTPLFYRRLRLSRWESELVCFFFPRGIWLSRTDMERGWPS